MHRYLIAFALLIFSSCYSFKGLNVPTGIKTFTVTQFENQAPNAAPTLSEVLTEDLKRKILSDAPLSYVQAGGDALFEGAITRYQITPINPKPGETNARNRLEIGLRVTYTCEIDEKLNWTENFTNNAEYDSSLNLASIESTLIREINTLLIDEIFNRSFAQW